MIMLAREIISSHIPALHPSDTAARALRLLNEYHVAQLPLVADDHYIGLVEEAMLLDWDDPDQTLSSFHESYTKPAIQGNTHFFDALKLMRDFRLSVLPVLEEDVYTGVVTPENILHFIAQFDEIQIPGAILVLDADPRDYSLTDIARIAESEEMHLLGIHLLSEPKAERLCILIKTDRQDLSAFTAHLDHYGYTVRYQFGELISTDTLQKNYDLLMNYINM